MLRALLAIGVECPARVEAGADLVVVVRPQARRPVDIAEAQARWVCRWDRHVRYWGLRPATMSPAWSEVKREAVEQVISSSRLGNLAGAHPAGAIAEQKVRFETIGVPASAVDIGGFGAVLSEVVVEIRLRSGQAIEERRRIWVRPASSSDIAGPPAVAQSASPAPGGDEPCLAITGPDGSSVVHGQNYRNIEGRVVVTGGKGGTGPGSIDLAIVSNSQWEVHHLAPMKAKGPATRRELQEVTMEREVSERRVKLGRLSVPAVPPGGRHEAAFCFKGPRGTSQTTATVEGFMDFRVIARWQCAERVHESSTPMILSMPDGAGNTGAEVFHWPRFGRHRRFDEPRPRGDAGFA